MKASEVFGRISTHMIEGMMLHDQMTDAFNFLTLPNFRKLQERRYYEESQSMRDLHVYFISHYNMLMDEGRPEDPHAIPRNWMGYSRQQVTMETKRKAIRDLIEHWVKWETETKHCYEKACMELMECGEVAAAEYVKKLVMDVNEELAYAQMLHIRLEGIGYDMPTIDQMKLEE